MEHLDILLVVAGALAAGFVQGLTGFAFTMVAMAFWSWSISPQLAIPLTVYGSLVGQMMAFNTLREKIKWSRLSPFLVGGVLGVPVGAMLLPSVDPKAFKIGIGLILVIWCPLMLFARVLPRFTSMTRYGDGGVGFIGGFMSGLCGLSGPAPTLWSTLRGWDKHSQRAVFQYFNLTMHAFTLTVYAVTGIIAVNTLRWFALITPAIVLSCILGLRLYTKLSDEHFRKMVLIFLALTGFSLLVLTPLQR